MSVKVQMHFAYCLDLGLVESLDAKLVAPWSL